MRILNLIKKEWFLVGMLLAIILAVFTPTVGQSHGVLHLDEVTQIGIGVIFFLYGVGLSPSAIKSGLSSWRLHIYTQAATFVIYPLIWVILSSWFSRIMPQALAYGFCYLLVLPSTISSSVTMTGIAKGNIPGAIFNASLSSVLGIFLTPLFVQIFMGVHGGSMDISATIIHIAEILLLPMIVGQIARPLLSKWVQRHKKVTGKIDKCVIILIVYNAFCDSVIKGIWHNFNLSTLILAIVLCAVILLFMISLLLMLAKVCHFNHGDKMAGLFCGTKKTLAAGVPMAKVIFGTNPMLGMLLLPIMIYHPMQIFICAILANRYAKIAPESDTHH
ncbi:bile acid:sodium symporter family protein [Celerinatantimonas sp. YJH-8]|uniref:bile acid:sodium symporter family protein n=1 Tax=Celerinatantimonas sp. YJH-8 TaxID=3228714 RepID=UPI0038C966CA